MKTGVLAHSNVAYVFCGIYVDLAVTTLTKGQYGVGITLAALSILLFVAATFSKRMDEKDIYKMGFIEGTTKAVTQVMKSLETTLKGDK